MIGFCNLIVQREFVLCCVRKKSGENVDAANCDEGESSTYNNASDFENQQLLAPGMDIEEVRMLNTNAD